MTDDQFTRLERTMHECFAAIDRRLGKIEQRMLTRSQLYRSIRIQAALTTGIVVVVLALLLFGDQP